MAEAKPPSDKPIAARISPGVVGAPRCAHLIGIGGTGMRSLSAVLVASGWDVCGSDADPDAASSKLKGVRTVYLGHRRENLAPIVDLVVYSPAIDDDNPELLAARQRGFETLSYPQMLARLSQGRTTLAVAGTHGKSTVTAMADEILAAAGYDPTTICGATPIDRASGGRLGRGPHFLVEACEYREHFLHLSPQVGVILNVEPDHFDCFPDQRAVDTAFSRFAEKILPGGVLLAGADCPAACRVQPHSAARRVTFGLQRQADWRGNILGHRLGCYSFQLFSRRRLVTDVSLWAPGVHNVQNAVAAAALSLEIGVSAADVRRGLARFTGLQRRLEVRGTQAGVMHVDDYAHHPTEVSASLATLRQMFPGRRICLFFQPHQVSRTERLLDEFAASLHNADLLAVATVFRAREPADAAGHDLAERLAVALRSGGRTALTDRDQVQLIWRFAQQLRPGDVLVTMGAGRLGNVCNVFGDWFRKNRQVG